MTLVHAATPSRCRHPRAGLRALAASGTPIVVVQAILFSSVVAIVQHVRAEVVQTWLHGLFATAGLHRWHDAKGLDGTHRVGSLIIGLCSPSAPIGATSKETLQ